MLSALLGSAGIAGASADRTAETATDPARSQPQARLLGPAELASAVLACRLATGPDQPLTFDPPIGMVPRRTTTRATLRLTECASKDPDLADLRTGTLRAHGTGIGSCTAASDIRGRGDITWYGRAGQPVATSTITPTLRKVTRTDVNGGNPADALLGGRVTDGALHGARVAGAATPTTDVNHCGLTGIRQISGAGRLMFLR